MKAKAYIVHRAMCEPVLEWSRPKNCLSFEPLYASTQAQPAQQEPFCYHDGHDIVGKEFADHSDVFPLYTSPPASKPWVGLTDEQFKKIKASLSHQEGWDGDGWDLALKEAIETKLKEKNA